MQFLSKRFLLLPFMWLLLPAMLHAQINPDSLYAAAAKMPADSLKARKINEIALAIARSNPSLAYRYAEEAMALCEQISFPAGQIRSAYIMGMISLNTGQPENALEIFTEALQVCNRYNLRKQKGEILLGMGNYFNTAGDQAMARSYAQQAIAIARETGDSLSVAKGLNNLSVFLPLEERVTRYQQSMAIMEALLARSATPAVEAGLLVVIYSNISSSYVALAQPETAMTYLNKAIELNKKLNNNFNNIILYVQIANINNTTGKYNEALRAALQALELGKVAYSQEQTMIQLQGLLSDIYLNLKKYPEAIKCKEEHCNLLRDIGNTHELAQATYEAANILLTIKNFPKALTRVNEALNLARMEEMFPLMVSCENLSGEIYAAQKDDTRALERFLRALDLISQHTLPEADFADVFSNLAACYARLGQAEKAQEMQARYDKLSPRTDSN